MPEWDETRFQKVKQNFKFMLDLRKIPGDDVEMESFNDCPGFIWGMQRGDEWLVLILHDVSKQAVNAVFSYCNPQEHKSEQDDESLPRLDPLDAPNRSIRHCIIVYLNKCTVIAAKEIETYNHTHIEVFNLNQILLSPFELKYQAEYELLSEEESSKVKQLYNAEGMAEIWTTDPVQRWFNAPVGSTYRITERWGLHPAITYRIVTPPNA